MNYAALLRSALVALLRYKMRSVLTIMGITIEIAAVICFVAIGKAAISIFEQKDADHYGSAARITTLKAARASFFSADLDRIFLAVLREVEQPAAIRIVTPGE